MTMQITVTVDENVLAEAARRAFAEAFRPPDCRDRRVDAPGGTGYETLRVQVSEYVRTLDMREYIRGAARAALDNIMQEVLEKELKVYLKGAAKAMRQDGTLFGTPNGETIGKG